MIILFSILASLLILGLTCIAMYMESLSDPKEKIKSLSKERLETLDKDDNDPKVDKLQAEILEIIEENFDDLPVVFIIEQYTKLGFSPSVLYDDNGYFCISDSGTQDIPIDFDSGEERQVQNMYFFVDDSNSWKSTIRKALKYWIDKMKEE